MRVSGSRPRCDEALRNTQVLVDVKDLDRLISARKGE
jgi:hypothetical protein